MWIWLAIDLKTKEIVGVDLGERGENGAKGLWNSLPGVYRQCGVCYSDFWLQMIIKIRKPSLDK